MPFQTSVVVVAPKDYVLAVKAILDAAGSALTRYESSHLEPVAGVDGEYVIDVVATFSALGADFRVLVECKHEKRRVERQDVQVLKAKLESTGAQKGMLFSVAGFQSGAIEYADAHGIALVELVDGASTWHARSDGPPTPPPQGLVTPKYVGWWCHGKFRSVMSPQHPEYARKALGLPPSAA
jgi:restriction system protein